MSGWRTPASLATLAELCYPLTSLVLGLFVLGTAVAAQWAGFGLRLVAVLGCLGAARRAQPGLVRCAASGLPCECRVS